MLSRGLHASLGSANCLLTSGDNTLLSLQPSAAAFAGELCQTDTLIGKFIIGFAIRPEGCLYCCLRLSQHRIPSFAELEALVTVY